MKSNDVQIWQARLKTPARTLPSGEKKPATYQLRWSVGGATKAKTFKSRALAEAHRAKLLVAVQRGEPFDIESGYPDSLVEKPQQTTWYRFAARYVDMKWKSLSPKSRESTIYALSSAVASLIDEKPGAPSQAVLRRALQHWYLEPSKRNTTSEQERENEGSGRRPPAEIVKALAWLEKNSLPVGALAQPKRARAVLDALATKMDGTVAAADYIKRRRGVVSNMARYAVECGELREDPFRAIQWTPPRVAKQIDRRRVPNPKQVRELLTGVSYVGTWKRAGGRRYAAFFGCLYYAMMRPEEVIALRDADCELPDEGWGLLVLHKATPYAGRRWTNDGGLHDNKALKSRASGETRSVPIPPMLVRMLRNHIDEFGVDSDGRIFRTEKGSPVTPFAYQKVWKQARRYALTPGRVHSALAEVPYDLRHAGISLGLRTTRDPALIAERAGQSVEVLMKRYAWALDDQDAAANRAIEEALDQGE